MINLERLENQGERNSCKDVYKSPLIVTPRGRSLVSCVNDAEDGYNGINILADVPDYSDIPNLLSGGLEFLGVVREDVLRFRQGRNLSGKNSISYDPREILILYIARVRQSGSVQISTYTEAADRMEEQAGELALILTSLMKGKISLGRQILKDVERDYELLSYPYAELLDLETASN